MRNLINRVKRVLYWTSPLEMQRIDTADINFLADELRRLEQRVMDMEQERRLAKAQAELAVEKMLNETRVADSDTTVTRLRPR